MNTISIEIAGVCNSSNELIRFSTGLETGSGFQCYPRSIVSFGSITSALDTSTNLTQTDETTIQLCETIENSANGEAQPISIFSAFSVDALKDSFILAQSVTSQSNEIRIKGSVSFLAQKLIHVGTESILLGEYLTSVDNNSVFSIAARGFALTTAQPHNVDDDIGFFPDVALVPFIWLGRRVNVYLDGDLWRVGVISTAPSVSEGVVSLAFVGIENRLTDIPQSVITPFKAYLSDTHVLKPQKMAGYLIRMKDRSPVYRGKHLRPATLTFDNTKFTGFSSEAEQIASIVMSAANAPIGCMLAGSCINRPRVVIDGQTVQTSRFLYVSGSECTLYHSSCGFVGPSDSTASLHDCYFYFLPEARLYTYRSSESITGGAKYLSDQLCSISRRSALYPVTYTTGEPLFNLFQETTPDGWIVTSKLAGGWHFQLGIVQRYQNAERPQKTTQKTLYSALLDEQPDLNLTVNQNYCINANPSVFLPKETAESALISYPIRLNGEPDSITRVEGRTNTYEIAWVNLNSEKNAKTKIPLLCANRWWELGDTLVLKQKIPGKDHQYLKVCWTEPDGVERTCKAYLSYLSTVQREFYYKCDTVAAGFGDWPGFDRCYLSQILALKSEKDSDFLLSFACSIDGLETNGASDVLPSGLCIDSALFNRSSFESFENMACVKGWDIDIAGETDVSSAVSTMLLSTVSTIAAGFNESAKSFDIQRLWLGYPTRETVLNSDTITDFDIIGLPSSVIDPNVVTSYELKFLGDSSITWRDVDAEQRYGVGSSLSLDLNSAILDQSQGLNLVGALRGSIGSFCEYYGTQKRKWIIQIPFKKAKNYRIGQVINVTSKYLSGYVLGKGIEKAPGLITRIDLDVTNGTANLEILAQKRSCGSYSPSLIVLNGTIIDKMNVEITVAHNLFSENDLSFFGVNDSVFLTAYGLDTEKWKITSINDQTNVIRLTSTTSKSRWFYFLEGMNILGMVEKESSQNDLFFTFGVDRMA